MPYLRDKAHNAWSNKFITNRLITFNHKSKLLKSSLFKKNKTEQTSFILFCSLIRREMVENSGIEPLTSCVQGRRSPSWANSPFQAEAEIRRLTVPNSLLIKAEACEAYLSMWVSWQRRVVKNWWVWADLNSRPHPYQGCALTNWATDPLLNRLLHFLG